MKRIRIISACILIAALVGTAIFAAAFAHRPIEADASGAPEWHVMTEAEAECYSPWYYEWCAEEMGLYAELTDIIVRGRFVDFDFYSEPDSERESSSNAICIASFEVEEVIGTGCTKSGSKEISVPSIISIDTCFFDCRYDSELGKVVPENDDTYSFLNDENECVLMLSAPKADAYAGFDLPCSIDYVLGYPFGVWTVNDGEVSMSDFWREQLPNESADVSEWAESALALIIKAKADIYK